MIKIEQTAEALAYVEAARKSDNLAELCRLEDYHPDHGMVEPYWKPLYLDFTKAFMREAIKFAFVDPDGCEEQLEVRLNGEVLATANHDDDGWDGMSKMRRTCEAIEAHFKK